MACPFSFMSRASSSPAMPLLQPVSDESLSAALRQGTAASHKAVERSEGVRRLMALPSASSSGLGGMSREEYIRWQVALLCVYSALENALDAHCSSPLFTSSGFAPLLPTLYRAGTLQADITAHLRVLAPAGNAADVSIGQLKDITEALAAEPCPAHEELLRLLQPAGRKSASVERELIATLDPLLATATLSYVRRLAGLGAAADAVSRESIDCSRPSTPSCGDSVLSIASNSTSASRASSEQPTSQDASLMSLFVHAYVRYLGDLSGGQHIVLRAKRLWPVEGEGEEGQAHLGFAFYDFDEAERKFARLTPGEGQSLKEAFRSALDRSGELSSSSKSSLAPLARFHAEVVEANAAFLANAALFDALAGVEPGSYLAGDEVDADATTTAADVARALRQRSGNAKGLPSIPRDSNHAHLRGLAHLQSLTAAVPSGMLRKGGKEHKTRLVVVELPWHPHVVATAAVAGSLLALGVALAVRTIAA